jgi:hypothetical protein
MKLKSFQSFCSGKPQNEVSVAISLEFTNRIFKEKGGKLEEENSSFPTQ